MHKQEQSYRTRTGGTTLQNSRPGVRGILAIILACITVVALASCDYGGSNYSNDLGTAPGAETQHCVAAQVGQGGKQPTPIAVKPHSAPPSEAMFGFDVQHTGFNPYEHTLSPTNVSRLVLDWTATTAKPLLAMPWSSPTVANGVVYVASNDEKLSAFNATTGAVLWSTCIGVATSSTPAVVKGVVYIGAVGGKLSALNATTGAVLWTAATAGNDIESTPAVAKGVVYVESSDGKLYAYNATTGAALWSTIINPRSTFGFSSPVVANGVVYITARDGNDGRLYAVDASTGTMLWTTTPNPGIDVSIYAPDLNTPALANGVVYVDSGDFKLFAYHLPD